MSQKFKVAILSALVAIPVTLSGKYLDVPYPMIVCTSILFGAIIGANGKRIFPEE